MLRLHLCTEALKLALEPVATGAVCLTIGYAGTECYLLSGVVVGAISIEGGHNDGCRLRLRSRFGLLATAGNPKKYTQKKK